MIVNGHLYYNNNLIKIRLDLLKEENSTVEYTDNQIFDRYKEILKFDKRPGCKHLEICETDMPQVEINSERLIYLVKNRKDLTPKRLLILPFLHNRNILMRTINPNREYFSTILRKEPERFGDKPSKHYVTLNMTDFKVNVFSESGFQVNRFTFKDRIKKLGKPKCVS